MRYVRVTDIPATWADYEPRRDFLETEPDGLVIFLAGPTDEGVRTVEVWTSREDWAHAAAPSERPAPHGVVTVRELDAPLAVPEEPEQMATRSRRTQ